MPARQHSAALVLLAVLGSMTAVLTPADAGAPPAPTRTAQIVRPVPALDVPVPPDCDPPPGSPCPVDPPTPVVRLRVRVPAAVAPNELVDYRISVENSSPAAAHAVTVRAAVPANARVNRAMPEPTAREGETLVWNLGSLPPCGNREIVLVLQPTGPADINLCARVSFEHGQCVTTRIGGQPAPPPPPQQPPPPPQQPPPPPVVSESRIVVQMTGPDRRILGRQATYQLSVFNPGNAPLTNVVVTDFLPQGTQFVSASDGGQLAGNQVQWQLGNLAPGARRSVQVTLRGQVAGEVVNRAAASADRAVAAQAESRTRFEGGTGLTMDIDKQHDPVEVGTPTRYTVIVVNQGMAPATNVRITAIIPPEMEITSAKGPAAHKIDGQRVVFDALPALQPKAEGNFEIIVRPKKEGDVRFRVEMSADQLPAGPVRREESTNIYSDEPMRLQPVPVK